jgi:hypothetical protein
MSCVQTNYTTLGGRVTCTQCNAKSKRTKQQCRNPAIKGKTKCKHHGGRSTGSKSPEGKARQIAANTKHGNETRAIREERSAKLAELYELEMLGRELGLISGGMVGRKPRPLDMLRTVVNICGDLSVATAVANWERRVRQRNIR